MFSSAENSMIHYDALTFNQMKYIISCIIFTIVFIILLIGSIYLFYNAWTTGILTKFRKQVSICYFIYFTFVLYLTGYITFTAANILLF